MADDKLNLEIGVQVTSEGTSKAEQLRKEFALLNREILASAKAIKDAFSALNSSSGRGRTAGSPATEEARAGRDALAVHGDLFAQLKKRWTFERRMTAQRKAEESDAARQVKQDQAETAQALQRQMQFSLRMSRQRAQAEAEAERETRREVLETGRMRDRENRKALADAKALQRAQQQAAQRVAAGAGQVRSGGQRAVVGAGAAGLALGYGTKRALDALTRSGVSIDSALNQNIRLSGLNPKDAQTKGVEIRKKAMPIARSLGIKTSEYLKARAEAIQAGVEDELVDTVTEFGSKYARLNDMAPSEVMESSGYGITALGAFGKVTADRVKQLFNLQQHLAATTAASRQGLNSFVRRGLSAGAAAGFSVEDTLAYGGAATSSGADGESAARMLSSTTERLASMPTRAAGIARKKHKSPKDLLILQLPRKLGFKSWADLKKGYSADAAGTVEKIYEGLAGITDPRARLEASEEIWGKEFGSVHASMAVGHRFRDMRRSVRSKDAGRAIDQGMSIRSGSFDMIMDQIGSTIQDLKDSLGLVLKPLWADLRDYALQAPVAFHAFEDAFKMGLRGFMQGLGSRDGTMAGLLRQWFGDPGAFKLNSYGIGDFARGFAQGLRDVGNAVVSFVRLFAGQNASPAEMGRWTARILGFSAALIVAAPAVAVLSGLGTAIAGFAGIVTSTWGLMKAAGIVGAAAGTPKVPANPGAAAAGGWLARFGSLLKMFGGAVGFNATAGLPKADQDALVGRLGAYAQQLEQKQKQGATGWVDPPLRKPVEQLQEQLQNNTEALHEGAKVQRQSFEALEDFRSLIHPASLGSAARSIGDAIRNNAARVGGSALSGAVGNGPLIGSSVPGGSIGNGLTGMRRRGIIGGGGSGGGAVSGPGNGSMPTSSTAGSLTDLINQEAARAGIDPRILHGIRAGESGKRADYDIKSDSKEDSYGPFQLNRRGGLGAVFERETGLDARDPKTIPAQTRWVAELIKKRGRGILRQWYGYRGDRDADPSWGNSGYVPNNPAGTGGGGSSASVVPGQGGQSASRLQGQIDVEGQKFDFGSGNGKGLNSIPFGTYPVTPDAIGPWGRANGALGINGNQIWDKTLGRMRTGIEFHAASNARMLTAGCIGIAREQYGTFKERLLSVYRRAGRAFLTVGPNGASISANRPDDPAARVSAETKRSQELGTRAGEKPNLGSLDVTPQGGMGTKAPLGANTPIKTAPAGSGGSAQGGGSVTNHVIVNAARLSPDELKNSVQRGMNDAMNRRSHDFDQAWA